MGCPVRIQCAEHALRVREPYGIWGGLSEEEREATYATESGIEREVDPLKIA
jgi:WhiB family redox-sensing transcriptional regulator